MSGRRSAVPEAPISGGALHKWRSRFGGMEVSDAKRLRTLEDESAKLKRLLATPCSTSRTLRETLGETSDARLEERCRELGGSGEGRLAAACPRASRHRADDLSPRPQPGRATAFLSSRLCDESSTRYGAIWKRARPPWLTGRSPETASRAS